MVQRDATEQRVRRYLRERIQVSGERDDSLSDLVRRLLPLGPPFALIDRIECFDGADPARCAVVGFTAVAADNPVFAGHFPGDPVYPATLQTEAMAQAVLAACALATRAPLRARLAHIVHAYFTQEVRPADVLEVRAELTELDTLRGFGFAQLLRGEAVCAAAAFEVIFV